MDLVEVLTIPLNQQAGPILDKNLPSLLLTLVVTKIRSRVRLDFSQSLSLFTLAKTCTSSQYGLDSVAQIKQP